MGEVIVVASGKGGTGKTSVCAGVSSILAALDKRVLVIDADTGNRSLDLVLGMSSKVLFSFADVALNRCNAEAADVQHPDIKGLYLLTAPIGELPPEVNKDRIRDLLMQAKDTFDYVFVDCPAGMGKYIQMFAMFADRGIVVATPDNTALRSAQLIAMEFDEWAVPDVKLVINRIRPKLIRKKAAYNIDDAMDMTGVPLLGIVPEDERVIAASNMGRPIIHIPHTKAMEAYRNIARRIMGQEIPLIKA